MTNRTSFYGDITTQNKTRKDMQFDKSNNTNSTKTNTKMGANSGVPHVPPFVLLLLQILYVLLIVVYPFVLFILAIVVSVLLRFTDSDYSFE